MKTIKKICLGFSAFLAFFILTLVFSPAHKALAAPQKSDVQQCAKTLKFKDIAHITCQLGGGKITFVDNNPTDQNYDHDKDYQASSSNYADESSDGAFCQDKTDYLDFSGGNFHISDAGSKKNAYLQLYYVEPGKPGCQSLAQNVTITNTSGIAILLNGGNNQAASLPDIGDSSHSLSGQSFTRYQNGSFDPKKGVALYASGIDDLESSCDGEILAVYYSGSSGATATEYDISGGGKSLSSFSNLAKLPKDTGCGVDKENFGLDNGAFKLSPAVTQISGSLLGQKCGAGQAVPNGYDCQCTHDEGGNSCVLVPGSSTTSTDQQSGTGKLDSETSCEGNSGGFPLSWALCPVLDAASSLSDKLVNLFEDQLSFKVGDLSGSSQAGNGKGEVRTSWSLIRDIASSLLIVVMLVMVLSQAVSFGPFDAYTIKKLLPKMVVAIIIMQVSWDLFSWVVGIFDDIGHGLTNLMYVPFGGVGNMSLQHLLGHAGLSGAGGDATLGFLDWAAIGAGLALGYAYVFAMLGMATVAIISVLAGLFTLIFRKILIIMLLILSPLALVAWILPGTASYWKMWRENFIKALSMFPIAVGIIAAGRIFAQVAGTQDNGTLIALIFVLVGFFGPLFILPKTFKWGGQAMQQAGNGIMKASSKISERPKKFFDKRQEGWNHYLTEKSQQRVANDEGFNWKTPWVYPIDKFRSGQWDPTYGRRGSDRRQRAVQSYVEQGEKSEQEAVNAAESRLIRERQQLRAKGGNHDLMLQAVADGLEYYNDPTLGKVLLGRRNQAERMAARKQLAKLGAGMNWRYLENYYEHTTKHGSDEERAEMRKFFDDNVETILPKLPHIYKSISQAADADPAAIANMHGVEVEAILSNLSQEIETGKTFDVSTGEWKDLTPGQVQARQTSLTTFLQNFQRAVENSQRGGPQLENGALRAVKGYLDPNAGQLIDTINDDEPHGRKGIGREDVLPGGPSRDLPLLKNVDAVGGIDAGHTAIISELKSSLASMINEDGYVQRGAGETVPTVEVRVPGEVKIQHREAAAQVLPPPSILSPGSAAWQAFKLQLKTDPNAVDVLANSIAHGVSAPEYHQVLEDMRNEAISAGTPEAAQEYNSMVSKIQQALQQRVNQTAAAAAARGHDATAARAAGANRIVDLEQGGGATYRKV